LVRRRQGKNYSQLREGLVESGGISPLWGFTFQEKRLKKEGGGGFSSLPIPLRGKGIPDREETQGEREVNSKVFVLYKEALAKKDHLLQRKILTTLGENKTFKSYLLQVENLNV